VDRRQLEYFLAVAAHGSFTGAAAALRIAQPSLSHAINAVEREVGAQLFHRVSHGVTLTAAGEALLRPAHRSFGTSPQRGPPCKMVTDLTAGQIDIVAQTTLAVHPLAGLVGAFRRPTRASRSTSRIPSTQSTWSRWTEPGDPNWASPPLRLHCPICGPTDYPINKCSWSCRRTPRSARTRC
jgi:DNA-binding transcriptional LysR family regulator